MKTAPALLAAALAAGSLAFPSAASALVGCRDCGIGPVGPVGAGGVGGPVVGPAGPVGVGGLGPVAGPVGPVGVGGVVGPVGVDPVAAAAVLTPRYVIPEGYPLVPAFPGELPCFTPGGEPYYTPGADPCLCFSTTTGDVIPC